MFPVETGGSQSVIDGRESHFVVVGGAPEPASEVPLGMSDARLIAADGGLRLCQRWGLWPELVVGDLDTLSEAEVQACEARGIEIERHPADKDQSDLELGLKAAHHRGATRVSILGALGGEWDHSVHNLLAPLSLCHSLGMWGRLLTDTVEIYLLRGGATLQGCEGRRVSLAALSERVEQVQLEGFQYRLSGRTVYRHETIGLANRVTTDHARITFNAGEMLLTLSGGTTPYTSAKRPESSSR